MPRHSDRTPGHVKLARFALAACALALACASAQAAVEIRLWHALRGADGAALEALAARFNASQKDYRVVPRQLGAAEGTLAAALAARKRADAPHVVQVEDAATADALAARAALRPLWQAMQEAGIALDPRAWVPAVASYYADAGGRLLALPLDVGTPLLYYNRDAFRRARLDPDRAPRTWGEMTDALGTLVEARGGCVFTTASPSWVLLENMSAWHNEEFATHGNGMDGPQARLTVNNGLGMRWISRLSTWAKTGYFSYSGRRREGDARFAAGECAVLTSSSASYAELRRSAKFDLGVAQFPFLDEFLHAPQNTLAGGGGLWVLSGAPRTEARGAARFIAFLMRPEVQLEWHQKTGYVPLLVAAYEQSRKQGWYRSRPAYEIAVRQLLFREPTRDSRGIRLAQLGRIRTIIDEELETVWSGRKTPIAALDAAVKRGNALLAEAERAARAAAPERLARTVRASVGTR